MEPNDPVVLQDGTPAILKQVPRCVGRKRQRALVTTLQGDKWVFLDELKAAENQKLEGE